MPLAAIKGDTSRMSSSDGVGLLTLVTIASGQQQFVDYDYQGQSLGPQSRPVASAGFSRGSATAAIKPTPVPIIKQINRHNDDGSYTYGYEGADGSFKIETKLPTGEVTGKYGYVDDTGKLRVVDYGANRYGFQPAGEGITVAPPTLVDETTDKTKENGFAQYDDEGILYAKAQPQPQPLPAPRQPKRPRPAQSRPIQFAPVQQYVTYEPETRTAAPTPAPTHDPISLSQLQQLQQQIQTQYPQQVQPQYPQQTFIAYESQPRAAPVSPRISTGPSSGRISVPGSIPAGPLFRPNALPSPVTAPVHAPVAAPVAAPPRPAPVREQPLRAAPSSGSVLDQLIQQFALPQGVGQPLHDISFGSYSSQTRF